MALSTVGQGLSFVQYETDGVEANFPLIFQYLEKIDVKVYVGSVEVDFTWLNAAEVTPTVLPTAGQIVTIRRFTKNTAREVNFEDGGQIKESLLDLDSNQLFYLTQEASDVSNFGLGVDPLNFTVDARGNRLINVAPGIDPTDGINMSQIADLVAAVETAGTEATQAAADAAASLVAAQNAQAAADAIEGIAQDALDTVSDLQAEIDTKISDAIAVQAVNTTEEIDNAIADLVNASPAALDTLDELAQALGDDPNFATTVATQMGNRLRIDTDAQGLNGTQKTNAKTNLDLQNVDNTSDATKNAATATLTNKSLVSPNRIDAKKDTKANLISYAFLTGQNGEVVYATDDKEYYGIKDGVLSPLGGGSSSLETILQLTASEQLSDWSTGDDATFLGGGTLSGSFVKETTAPLHGAASYKYTQAAGSLNDYLVSAAFPVDTRFRGTQVYLQFPYKYDGSTNDIQIILYDATNSAIITTTSDVVVGTNNANQSAVVAALIPLTCASIRVGFQVKSLNSGKVFQFDDVQLSQSLYQISSTSTLESIEALTQTTTFGSINTGVPVLNITKNTANGIIRIDSSATNGTSFVALKDCEFSILASVFGTGSGTASAHITRNATVLTSSSPDGLVSVATNIDTGYRFQIGANLKLLTGDIVRLQRNGTDLNTIAYVTITVSSTSSNIVTPIQQISSDTLPFTFKATAITASDPIGTYNTYTYAANTNVATISASAPTQTSASMNTNGFQLTARAYNAASTTATPTRVDVKIGPGLKAQQILAYVSTGKVNPISYDHYLLSNTNEYGVYQTYDENTGILSINAGVCISGTVSVRRVGNSLITFADEVSGYFVFNASTAPSIAALPIQGIKLQAPIAASGTAIDVFIPYGVKRINIMLNGLSTNGTTQRLLRIGDGTIATTGYTSATSDFINTAGAQTATNTTSGFALNANSGSTSPAASTADGIIQLALLGNNIWVVSGTMALSNGAVVIGLAGAKTLVGMLDRIRLTTASGTDSFDAGIVAVSWEF